MKYISIFALAFLLHCQTVVPWKSEWKPYENSQVFIAAVSAKASEKAIDSGSLAMRRSTCVEATNLLSTSHKLTSILVAYENQELTESEIKDLGRLISTYKIKPKQEECQSTTEASFFSSTAAWTNCQCLYRIDYPGGRKQFQSDLTQAK